jgi:hypothetical protein
MTGEGGRRRCKAKREGESERKRKKTRRRELKRKEKEEGRSGDDTWLSSLWGQRRRGREERRCVERNAMKRKVRKDAPWSRVQVLTWNLDGSEKMRARHVAFRRLPACVGMCIV